MWVTAGEDDDDAGVHPTTPIEYRKKAKSKVESREEQTAVIPAADGVQGVAGVDIRAHLE